MSLVRAAAASVSTLLQGRLSSLLGFALAFRVINLLALAPLVAALTRLFLSRWGRASVGNFELATFLFSPLGVTALLVIGAVSLAIFYLEQAGLMRLLHDPSLPWWQALAGLGPRVPRLVDLGLRQLGTLLLLAAPLLASLGGLYWWLWSEFDTYALLALKPPRFWYFAGPAGILVAVAVAVGAWILLRWSFALPTVLFEAGTTAGRALSLSWKRTSGHLITIAGLVCAWVVVQALASAAVLGLLHQWSDWLLDRSTSSLKVALAATAGVLAVDMAAATALSIVGSIGLAALLLTLYRFFVNAPADPQATTTSHQHLRWRPLRWVLVLIGLGVLAMVVAVQYASYLLVADLSLQDRVEITAHRAGSKLGPENSVTALKRSIDAGADWAELDVLLTADGALAVLHDEDTLRVSGVRHVVSQSTLEVLQGLDIGTSFSAEDAGERIPTLDEMLAAASNQIGLNIELKVKSGRDVKPLVDAVLQSIRRADGQGRRTRICSQSLDAMKRAKSQEPGLEVGFIAGAAIGDLTRLEVDFLMVSSRLATRNLVAAATARKLPVHAWTVNDTDLMTRLVDRGVSNIITSNPKPMLARRRGLQELSTVERLLLRVRNLISD